jgi:hypothetical protein
MPGGSEFLYMSDPKSSRILPVNLYLSYRADDASGFALSLSREIRRQAPEATVVPGRVEPGARAAAIPDGAIVLLIAGTRWLRAAPDAPAPITQAGDPLRTMLEDAMRRRLRIVPVVFQIPLERWQSMCGELPSTLQPMSRFHGFEIRQESFQADIERLLGWLRAPDREVPWTEAPARTLIQVESEGGGLVKWWTGRDKTLRVVVDGSEVGALTGFNGRIDAAVEPGRHTVQVREGSVFKSEAVVVEVARGGTVSLVCGRNSFTGAVSLAQKR